MTKTTLILACTSLAILPALAKDDRILGDFEDGTYNGWTIEGDAFGEAPATGTIGKQRPIKGFVGKGLVNTFLDQDRAMGTLTSPAFKIEHKFLRFLQGGGYWKKQTEIRLLIDGEVSAITVGENSPQLHKRVFDLRAYQGKTAQVQIVDQANRGWGHVLADEFILCDEMPPGYRLPMSDTLQVDGKVILLPIDNTIIEELPNAPKLTIKLGETLLYGGHVYLADSPEKVSWWSPLHVPEADGKQLTLKYEMEVHSQALKMIKSGPVNTSKAFMREDPLRPQLRFAQGHGWSNDPNGMLYYDGEYHLFFQSNPFGLKWANMFWGHAVSKDLIHWEERPYALRPWAGERNHHPAMSGGMCFSGGGTVDHNNTLGLQKGDVKTLFVTFTAKGGGGERLAYSADKGKTWTVKPGRLFAHSGRDPKPFWYPPSHKGSGETSEPGHWVIAVYNDQKDRGGKNISFYTSKDLEEWTYQSCVPGFYECPEFFELAVDGEENNKKWVLMGADAKYLLGQFDGKRFIPDSGQPKTFEEGKKRLKETIVGQIFQKIYAGQCFSNTPDGRVIYVGWAGMTREADKRASFHNGFTLPIHLTLVSGPDGPRLNAQPIAEVDQLRDKKLLSRQNEGLSADNKRIAVAAKAQEYDLVLKLRSPQKNGVANLKLGETTIPIDLTRDDPSWQFSPEPGEPGAASIRVICDRPFMEVVSGNGRRYQMINRSDRGKPVGEIALEHIAGIIEIEEFTVHNLKSIWK